MNIEYAKNPIWANAENTAIDLVVKFEELPDEVPFTAAPNDVEEHSRTLYNHALDGSYGEIAVYQVIEPVIEGTSSSTVTKVSMRQMRLALLNRNRLEDVTSAIDSITDTTERDRVRIEWEYSIDVVKTYTWFQTIATNMNILGEDYDNLFVEASLL